MSREDFEGIRQHAKEQHNKRVSDTPRRVQYAVKLLEENGIEYLLKNPQTGHFHCRRKRDDMLFQFYAGTGKIQGETQKRGIHALIEILTEKETAYPPCPTGARWKGAGMGYYRCSWCDTETDDTPPLCPCCKSAMDPPRRRFGE